MELLTLSRQQEAPHDIAVKMKITKIHAYLINQRADFEYIGICFILSDEFHRMSAYLKEIGEERDESPAFLLYQFLQLLHQHTSEQPTLACRGKDNFPVSLQQHNNVLFVSLRLK